MDDSLLLRLLRENFRQQALNYAIAMVAMVVIAVTSALTAWIMKDIINSMTESGSRAQVYSVAFAVAVIFMVKGIATYIQVVWLGKAGNSIIATMQRKLYNRMLKHGVAFFEDGASSDLLMRVTNSAQGARQVMDTIVTGFVRDMLTLVGLVFVMFYQQPLLSIVCLLFGPIAFLGIRKILEKVRKMAVAEMVGTAEIIKTVQETSSGIRVVKAFDLERTMISRMNAAVRSVEKRANKIKRLEAATSPLMETLGGLAIASIVALSTVEFFGRSGGSAGQLMSFVTAVLMAYEPAKRLAKMRVKIEIGMRRVRMMYEIIDLPVNLVEKKDAVDIPSGSGDIEFKDVTFGYGDQTPIIQNLNLNLKAGQTTALVGPSGGGKSTIMNLIMRLHDPLSGSVSIADIDLKDATFQSIRNQIAFIGQDTFLFSGTVRDNISLGRQNATEDEIVAAAKAANAHDFILRLGEQYDTDVGENGGNLSGGQRQRIAIARAILRDSPILLMDEATSALDSESEYQVKEALDKAAKGRSMIIIAHRLSTILSADRIVVINAGRVEEDGNLEELLQRNGLFRKLYDHQFDVAEPF